MLSYESKESLILQKVFSSLDKNGLEMHHSVVHMKRRKLLLPKSVQTIPHSLEKSETTPCPMECQLLMLRVCVCW